MTTGEMPQEQGHTILHTRIVYDRWAKFLIATVRSPDGQAVEREIEDHGEAVCVLPYNAERKTAILVRQMRRRCCSPPAPRISSKPWPASKSATNTPTPCAP